MWVPIVENNEIGTKGAAYFIKKNIQNILQKDKDLDTLVLGCTHYPFLARTISDVLGSAVTLVSSADETAFAARDRLAELGLLRSGGVGTHRFLSSGDIDLFRELGGRLLGPELAHTERWPLQPA